MTLLLRIGVCVIAVFIHQSSWALIPIEGLLQGRIEEDLQFDPLSTVFQIDPETSAGSRSLHKRYQSHYLDSQRLKISCEYIGKSDYTTPTVQTQALRSVVGTLQYLGLDLAVKSIAQLSQAIQMEEAVYQKMIENLTQSSCSPNMTVYGLKLIKQNLLLEFAKPSGTLPMFPAMPLGSKALAYKASSLEARERELHHSLQIFRSLCSWGGDTDDYRLLPPLLNNSLVMSWVFRHLEAKQIKWNEETNEASISSDPKSTIQVLCTDLICRRVSNADFYRLFPRSIGATDIGVDLKRMWCQHFRDQTIKASSEQHPKIREWAKSIDPEEEHMMTSHMLSLITGVSDLILISKNYQDLNKDLRSGIDERWSVWAGTALSRFSRDMLFEESLEISVVPLRDLTEIRQNRFAIDFNITMGELDKILHQKDKLGLTMSLNLSKNWLYWVKREWSVVLKKSDPVLRDEFISQIAAQLKVQIDKKKKYFKTPLFGDGLEELVANELIEQIFLYEGRMFSSLEDKMMKIPIRFHYGMFALSYMRYKAELKVKGQALDL
jgi:hypothetical protein